MRADQRARRDAFLSKIDVRPVVVGVLNVTPDSFSDGGRFRSVEAAIARARQMIDEGADIIDVGAESTRPGAVAVPEAEELARLEPVLASLRDLPFSTDTYKAHVAARAVEAGAILVNDVWGLQRDAAMADTVAASEAAVVIMHNGAEKDREIDIIDAIRRFFDHSLALAAKAGIPTERIILDPGIGFAKTARQNVDAVRRLAELKDYGRPFLVGVSRKKFLGSSLGDGSEGERAGTIAAALAAAACGASLFRVHDVADHVAALKVFETVRG
jgi:dihydropteroate synthase